MAGSSHVFIHHFQAVRVLALFLASASLQLQNAQASLERVSALFEIVPEENPGTGRRVVHFKGEAQFDNVSFSYDRREKVLQEVSFHVLP